MFKNVTGQKFLVFAFADAGHASLDAGEPVTGDAAQITGKVRKDYGAATSITDTNPTEIEDGFYEFDAAQAETNANVLDVLPESSTDGVQVVGVPARIYTRPQYFADLTLQSDGVQHVDAATLAGRTISGSGAITVNAQVGADNKPVVDGSGEVVASNMRGTDNALLASGYTAPDNATIGTIDTNVSTLLTRIPAALFAGGTSLFGWLRLALRSDPGVKTDEATALGEINVDGGSGAGDFDSENEAQEAIRDRGDAAWTTGAEISIQSGGETASMLAASISSVDLCNAALAFCGISKSISSLTESSVEAEVCNREYLLSLDEVLEDHQWQFAKRYRKIESSAVTAANATYSGGEITITTTAAHGLAEGDGVELSLFTPSGYDGTYLVTDVPSATTFKVAQATGPGASPASVMGTVDTQVYGQWYWKYKYNLPDDCLTFLGFDAEGIRYEEAESGHILTNESPTIKIRYIARVTDLANMPMSFKKALSLKLASNICMALTKDLKRSDWVETKYQRSVTDARFHDSARESQQVLDSSWANESRQIGPSAVDLEGGIQ